MQKIIQKDINNNLKMFRRS